jgi:hypothetical protein
MAALEARLLEHRHTKRGGLKLRAVQRSARLADEAVSRSLADLRACLPPPPPKTKEQERREAFIAKYGRPPREPVVAPVAQAPPARHPDRAEARAALLDRVAKRPVLPE